MAEQLALCTKQLSEDHRRSLEELYASHFSAVLACCKRILKNPDDAADAAQEVFMKAIELAPTERSTAQLRPWLLLVARNHCLDLLRRRKRFDGIVQSGTGLLEHYPDPEGTTITRHTVAAVFSDLRLRERQALWQSAVEGRSPAGIAERLGLSYMAAAQLLHRARRHAVLAAARVAAILYVWRRLSPRGQSASARLVALASVPLLAASTTSATPTKGPVPTRPATFSRAPGHASTTVADATQPALQVSVNGGTTGLGTSVAGVGHSIGGPIVADAHDVVHKLKTTRSCLLPSAADTVMAPLNGVLNCATGSLRH